MPDTATPDAFTHSEVGSTVQSCPFRDGQPPVPSHWLEIQMVGEDDQPVPWLLYEVKLPDGQLVQGYLDDQGLARIDQIAAAGTCEVSFPEFDSAVWGLATATGT